MKEFSQYIEYLYSQVPLFQNVGQGAYKEGLENTHILDDHFGHPHEQFKTIHIAGTNGKGSCSHTIASVLQEAGYKVGLYTSPHLISFRERIRVNGEMIPEQYVMDFIDNEKNFFEPLYPSFFELTTALSFKYFAEMKVDVAVVEVGLGGRLDCTNIINPDLSIITNISFDHMSLLGNTLGQIASEKAGIMKEGIPVVIGETCEETKNVFLDHSKEVGSPIFFAEEFEPQRQYEFELKGLYQEKNLRTILCAISHLIEHNYNISEENIKNGLQKVCENTGLMGRWQTIQTNPTVVCDTGHNVGGIQYVVKQLAQQHYSTLRIVIGMVNDKDINGVLAMLPKEATYYFCQASVKRARPADEITLLGKENHLEGKSYPTVEKAYNAALKDASENDFIFVGGSSYIVADLLTYLSKS